MVSDKNELNEKSIEQVNAGFEGLNIEIGNEPVNVSDIPLPAKGTSRDVESFTLPPLKGPDNQSNVIEIDEEILLSANPKLHN